MNLDPSRELESGMVQHLTAGSNGFEDKQSGWLDNAKKIIELYPRNSLNF
jgi:hypothetical protein